MIKFPSYITVHTLFVGSFTRPDTSCAPFFPAFYFRFLSLSLTRLLLFFVHPVCPLRQPSSSSYVLIRRWVVSCILNCTRFLCVHVSFGAHLAAASQNKRTIGLHTRYQIFHFTMCMSYSEIKSGSFSKLPKRAMQSPSLRLHQGLLIAYMHLVSTLNVYSFCRSSFAVVSFPSCAERGIFLTTSRCNVWKVVAASFVNEMDAAVLVCIVVTTLIVSRAYTNVSLKTHRHTHTHTRQNLTYKYWIHNILTRRLIWNCKMLRLSFEPERKTESEWDWDFEW